MDNSDFYDNVPDIHIMTEGYQGGYMVKVEYCDDDSDEDSKVYHVTKSDIINILQNLHNTVVKKGETDGWEKFWPRN